MAELKEREVILSVRKVMQALSQSDEALQELLIGFNKEKAERLLRDGKSTKIPHINILISNEIARGEKYVVRTSEGYDEITKHLFYYQDTNEMRDFLELANAENAEDFNANTIRNNLNSADVALLCVLNHYTIQFIAENEDLADKLNINLLPIILNSKSDHQVKEVISNLINGMCHGSVACYRMLSAILHNHPSEKQRNQIRQSARAILNQDNIEAFVNTIAKGIEHFDGEDRKLTDTSLRQDSLLARTPFRHNPRQQGFNVMQKSNTTEQIGIIARAKVFLARDDLDSVSDIMSRATLENDAEIQFLLTGNQNDLAQLDINLLPIILKDNSAAMLNAIKNEDVARRINESASEEAFRTLATSFDDRVKTELLTNEAFSQRITPELLVDMVNGRQNLTEKVLGMKAFRAQLADQLTDGADDANHALGQYYWDQKQYLNAFSTWLYGMVDGSVDSYNKLAEILSNQPTARLKTQFNESAKKVLNKENLDDFFATMARGVEASLEEDKKLDIQSVKNNVVLKQTSFHHSKQSHKSPRLSNIATARIFIARNELDLAAKAMSEMKLNKKGEFEFLFNFESPEKQLDANLFPALLKDNSAAMLNALKNKSVVNLVNDSTSDETFHSLATSFDDKVKTELLTNENLRTRFSGQLLVEITTDKKDKKDKPELTNIAIGVKEFRNALGKHFSPKSEDAVEGLGQHFWKQKKYEHAFTTWLHGMCDGSTACYTALTKILKNKPTKQQTKQLKECAKKVLNHKNIEDFCATMVSGIESSVEKGKKFSVELVHDDILLKRTPFRHTKQSNSTERFGTIALAKVFLKRGDIDSARKVMSEIKLDKQTDKELKPVIVEFINKIFAQSLYASDHKEQFKIVKFSLDLADQFFGTYIAPLEKGVHYPHYVSRPDPEDIRHDIYNNYNALAFNQTDEFFKNPDDYRQFINTLLEYDQWQFAKLNDFDHHALFLESDHYAKSFKNGLDFIEYLRSVKSPADLDIKKIEQFEKTSLETNKFGYHPYVFHYTRFITGLMTLCNDKKYTAKVVHILERTLKLIGTKDENLVELESDVQTLAEALNAEGDLEKNSQLLPAYYNIFYGEFDEQIYMDAIKKNGVEFADRRTFKIKEESTKEHHLMNAVFAGSTKAFDALTYFIHRDDSKKIIKNRIIDNDSFNKFARTAIRSVINNNPGASFEEIDTLLSENKLFSFVMGFINKPAQSKVQPKPIIPNHNLYLIYKELGSVDVAINYFTKAFETHENEKAEKEFKFDFQAAIKLLLGDDVNAFMNTVSAKEFLSKLKKAIPFYDEIKQLDGIKTIVKEKTKAEKLADLTTTKVEFIRAIVNDNVFKDHRVVSSAKATITHIDDSQKLLSEYADSITRAMKLNMPWVEPKLKDDDPTAKLLNNEHFICVETKYAHGLLLQISTMYNAGLAAKSDGKKAEGEEIIEKAKTLLDATTEFMALSPTERATDKQVKAFKENISSNVKDAEPTLKKIGQAPIAKNILWFLGALLLVVTLIPYFAVLFDKKAKTGRWGFFANEKTRAAKPEKFTSSLDEMEKAYKTQAAPAG